jgi:hypothetical protein
MEFILLTIGLYFLSLAGGIVYALVKFEQLKEENEKEVKQKTLLRK